MASTTITVPDAVLPRVLDAVAATQGYNPATDGTKAQFLKAFIARTLKGIVAEYEASAAASAAAASARSTANSDIAIT